MGKWAMEELKALTPSQRHRLFNNARTVNSPEAKELVMLLEIAGLPYSEGACLAMDDPITLKIGDLLNSKEGTIALIAATEAGLPHRSDTESNAWRGLWRSQYEHGDSWKP